MDKPVPYDVVRLAIPLPAEHLLAGREGTVIEAFAFPDEAFLVEFPDDNGETVALPILTADQTVVVWKSPVAVPGRATT